MEHPHPTDLIRSEKPAARPRVALIGVGGYGRVHLRHLLDFHAAAELEFTAAVAYPPDLDDDIRRELGRVGCEIFDRFEAFVTALPRLRLTLAIVPTPIHLHARMTIPLLQGGVHVLVEKPIAAIPADAEAIARAAEAADRVVAVGFQYLHAPEVRALKQQLVQGAIGSVRRIVVHAAWPRSHRYYTRNNWAGRLHLGGSPVLDSPVSNAMSHFMMLMLFLAGTEPEGPAQPVRLTAELYRAQAIDSFDTAALRWETATGCRLEFYGTHSSAAVGRPTLQITGDRGTAEWVQDSHASVTAPGMVWRLGACPEASTRERMLRDVLRRCATGEGPVCGPALAAAHVRCVAALHQHVAITPIPRSDTAERTEHDEPFTFVPGLDVWLAAAASQGVGLAAAGAPWAIVPATVAL